jgi:Ca2+-binding EF-hand superfamily protein
MVGVADPLHMLVSQLDPLAYRKMDLEEFCAAAISPYQLEALESWEEIAGTAFQHFEQEGNRVISVEELAQVRSERMCMCLSLLPRRLKRLQQR